MVVGNQLSKARPLYHPKWQRRPARRGRRSAGEAARGALRQTEEPRRRNVHNTTVAQRTKRGGGPRQPICAIRRKWIVADTRPRNPQQSRGCADRNCFGSEFSVDKFVVYIFTCCQECEDQITSTRCISRWKPTAKRNLARKLEKDRTFGTSADTSTTQRE